MDGKKLAHIRLREALMTTMTKSSNILDTAKEIKIKCISKINIQDIPFLLRNDLICINDRLESLLTNNIKDNEQHDILFLLVDDMLDLYTKLTNWIAIENHIYNQNIIISSNFKN